MSRMKLKEKAVENPMVEAASDFKYLNPIDMATIEKNQEVMKVFVLEVEKMDLKIQHAKVVLELMTAKIKDQERAIEDLQKERLEKLQLLNDNKTSYQSYVKELKSKLGLTSENWGFDPDTGKITE